MAVASTPIKSGSATLSPSSTATPQAPPPPVIPTSWLAPNEQRLFFAAIFGLIELTKLWEVLAAYLPFDIEPSWSSALRVQGSWTAGIWIILEFTIIFGVSFLRIPMISPSIPQLAQILLLLIGWNILCWFLAEPSAFVLSLNIFGPPALGHYWWSSPIFGLTSFASRLIFGEQKHIDGIHTIRLLPYSTATLNPLSLTYCIPPDSPEPLYIPVVFNNSIPDQVSYYIQSLDTGDQSVETVSATSMKQTPSRPVKLRIADEDEDETQSEDNSVDPLSALVLRNAQVDLTKLPSIKPVDSLALLSRNLENSQHILFVKVNKPSLITLRSVVDKRGDRFHITPHREAIVVECPTGGNFVEQQNKGTNIGRPKNRQAIETRCIGDEEIALFEVRGVGALRVAWKKKGKDSTESGVIEGIEDELDSADHSSLVRRDRVSKTHAVPLRLLHDTSGTFTVSLTSVVDSLHNVYTPSAQSQMTFKVLPRPSVRLNCPSPIQLLVNQSDTVKIEVDGRGALESPLIVSLQFTDLNGKSHVETVEVTKNSHNVPVSQPGIYTLLDVSGTCAGTVLEPASCIVQMVPPPTMEMSVTTLHECAMDVGVTAAFDFTGTAPFTIEWTEQRKGHRSNTHRQTFSSPRGEIVLQPEEEGEYTYKFTGLRDKRYTHIKLDKPPIQQTVHPLASADIVGRNGGATRHSLYACDGDDMTVELESRGIPPLRLSYLKTWGSQAENVTLPIKVGKSKISVPIPAELSAGSGASGKVTVALLSIEDGNGCVRKLPPTTVEVDINRQKPSARFAKSQKVVITEGDAARAPLRLTGDGPWEVTYSLNGKTERTITVKDSHCSGDIIVGEATFEVDFKPRPSVQLVKTSALTKQQDVFRHKGFCAGEEDQVALKFDGQSPFELRYRYIRNSGSSQQILKSAQSTGILHLATEPGHHRYEFMELVDGNYPSTPISILLEQDVYSRPSATFTKQNSHFLCLDQPLRTDAKLNLKGTAPFTLEFSVRKAASTIVSLHHLQVDHAGEWAVNLPHIVKDVGRHEVTLTKLEDASGCEWLVGDGDRLSTTVEVVETARIVPVGGKEDLCVGDTLDFILQGKSPWTIEYTWQGTPNTVTSSISRFSRRAESSGIFGVLSVAHKSNQCKRQITDIERRVHPLPSVKIQEGLDSLREGDEPAVFGVSFTGTPPFTFTYTRSEQVGSKSKVVETQTITDIWEKTYTITSSSPGDYTVTSVSDAYCRYPPLSRKMIES